MRLMRMHCGRRKLMSKVIEARAVISAADKTGNVFRQDRGQDQRRRETAKAFQGIKAAAEFLGDFGAELARLKLNERELQSGSGRASAISTER